MTAPAGRRWCPACQGLAGTLPARGLAPWFLVTESARHYLATRAAIRRLRGTAPTSAELAVLTRLDAIAETGQVAWVDVDGHGEFVVCQAAHGVIPAELSPASPP